MGELKGKEELLFSLAECSLTSSLTECMLEVEEDTHGQMGVICERATHCKAGEEDPAAASLLQRPPPQDCPGALHLPVRPRHDLRQNVPGSPEPPSSLGCTMLVCAHTLSLTEVLDGYLQKRPPSKLH